MNRHVEFKCWHKPTGRMYYGVHFTKRTVELATKGESLYRKDCVLMEFTGVYDQHGNKIWEGDVYRTDYEHEAAEIARGEVNYSAYYYVTFQKAGFCFMHVGETDSVECETYHLSEYNNPVRDIRVGNLCANPELWTLAGEQPLVIGG